MVDRPHTRMAIPPPRRGKRWPLVLFILSVIAGIAATVLLANQQRNLSTLMRSVGLTLPAPAAHPARAPDADPGTIATPLVARPAARWPWPDFAGMPGLMETVPAPADMCSAQAAGALEIPTYAESEQSGWECSMSLDGLGANRSASLSLQARGPMHAAADTIRITFDLADERLDGDLAGQVLAFFRLAASMPRDPALSDRLSKILASRTDFYFLAGYQGLTFRQEAGNPGRYNLVGIDRTSNALTGNPRLWATGQPSGRPVQDTKAGRLPRLLTLPAGSD